MWRRRRSCRPLSTMIVALDFPLLSTLPPYTNRSSPFQGARFDFTHTINKLSFGEVSGMGGCWRSRRRAHVLVACRRRRMREGPAGCAAPHFSHASSYLPSRYPCPSPQEFPGMKNPLDGALMEQHLMQTDNAGERWGDALPWLPTSSRRTCVPLRASALIWYCPPRPSTHQQASISTFSRWSRPRTPTCTTRRSSQTSSGERKGGVCFSLLWRVADRGPPNAHAG